ncbi:AEC family transporter [Benzoatithermus flavus]|uniref:AEC family transporter n=1 Tax=Benzoatithermus flavus TaxID=3108223 RepID=A0ABU8XV19_9PROT
MAIILGVALPFFAVLLCGMLAARLRLLDEPGLFGLNAFVFWFALPALLFQKVAATPFERLTDGTLYVGYEGSCLLAYLLVLVLFRRLGRRSLPEAAICAFAAAWGNVGYMGVPLLIAAYGEGRALPSVLAVVLDTSILQTLTILLIEHGGGTGKGGVRAVARAVVCNPLILAVLAGGVLAWLRLPLPAPVAGFLGLLGPAAGPGALFALGATLRGGALTRGIGLIGAVTAAKLLLLPAIAWLLLRAVPVPSDLAAPLLVSTALPTAASVFVIAQRYQVLERQVAAIVFASHLLGILTLTGVLVLLGT